MSASDIILSPIEGVAWIISLPVRILTWIVANVRARAYDPEKVICPGCGFRGDKGTNGKTCRINHVKSTGIERAANQHCCFRCGALFYSKLFLQAEKWIKVQ